MCFETVETVKSNTSLLELCESILINGTKLCDSTWSISWTIFSIMKNNFVAWYFYITIHIIFLCLLYTNQIVFVYMSLKFWAWHLSFETRPHTFNDSIFKCFFFFFFSSHRSLMIDPITAVISRWASKPSRVIVFNTARYTHIVTNQSRTFRSYLNFNHRSLFVLFRVRSSSRCDLAFCFPAADTLSRTLLPVNALNLFGVVKSLYIWLCAFIGIWDLLVFTRSRRNFQFVLFSDCLCTRDENCPLRYVCCWLLESVKLLLVSLERCWFNRGPM